MGYCNNCKVKIKGKTSNCPLCENYIKNDDKIYSFPLIMSKKEKTYYKYFVFFSLLSSILCIILDFFYPTGTHWSYFVILGNITFLILLYIIINYNKSLSKTIFWSSLVILFISLLWDYFTSWHSWSITFVIPIMITFNEFNYLLMFLIKNINNSNNLLYSIVFSVLGIIGSYIILLLKPYTTIPTLICLLTSFIVLIYLIFFKWRHLKNELKRRLHL